MKKLKYLFTFLFAVLLLPSMVSAKETIYFKPYQVGDEITVTLDKDGKVKGKFRVIEASPEGEQKDVEEFIKGKEAYEYVTAIYEGTVGESAFTSGKKVNYEGSLVRSNLVIKTTNLGWINYEEIRLLTRQDLTRIGVENGKVVSPWLIANAPYWLGEDMNDSLESYMVDANGNIVLKNAKELANIRPVIKIHKGFVEGGMICNCEDCTTTEKYCPNDPSMSIQSCIDSGKSESFCIMTLCNKKQDKVCPNDKKINIQGCIDEGKSEEDCIKKLCPNTEEVENPKTGNHLPLGIGMISIALGSLYIVTRKKTYFSK